MAKGMRWFGAFGGLVVAAATAGLVAHRHVTARLPAAGIVAEGIVVDGEPVPSGARPRDVAARHADRWLARRMEVVHGEEVVVAGTLGELGLIVDRDHVERAVAAVAHEGDLWHRLDDADQARGGGVTIAVPVRMRAEAVIAALRPWKRRLDRDPVPARWSFAEDRPVPHVDGRRLDPHRVVEAIVEAARRGETRVELPLDQLTPAATTEVVAAIDQGAIVSSYETRYAYVGNQEGRAQNLERASEGIDGLVLLPGETMSFNALVGPRSVDNGFARAGEIYKGEMRMGTGGGTCQVASTLHAAAYFGALEVVERAPHSRPSGYIGVGLDATVAYPTVDLRLKNPLPFAVVVHATAKEGTMRVELRGRERPAEVAYASATVKVSSYKRKVRKAHWLPEGTVIRKQAGRRGMTIEKTRTIVYSDGTKRVETTEDVYPPTNEVYFVAADANPTDVLPPLPPGVTQI